MTDTTRRQALASAGFAMLGASLASSSRAAENSPSAPGLHFNVRDYGAKGDGATDDTAAFQKALETAAHAGGGIVFAPTGNYLVKGHVVVPDNVALEGVFRAPTARSQNRGTTLLTVEGHRKAGSEPFIFLHANSVLKGVTVFYPGQDREKPVPYPWCVRGIGDNCESHPCVAESKNPGAVFEIRLRNDTSSPQTGDIVFGFPGFADHRTTMRQVGFPHWAATPQPPQPMIERRELSEPLWRGVFVQDNACRVGYALTALHETSVRIGGSLGSDGAKWAAVGAKLTVPDPADAGASLAVRFVLQPGQRHVVRFVLAWHAPQWEGSGTPFTGGEPSKVAMDLTGGKPFQGGRWYTHMYARRYADAVAVARFLAENHASLLGRVLAWQEAIYGDPQIPGWLADSLINILYLYPECSVWAPAEPPIGAWCNPEDGLFGMVESARSCPQMECLPVTAISGILPTAYFFPELVRSNARGWKAYQLPSGQMRFNFGLYWDMTSPNAEGNQEVMNGGNYMTILDRYWVVTKDEAFLREFYESAKRACLFSFEKQRSDYGLAQIVAMPTPIPGSYNYREWFEDREWKGYVAHPGGYRIAQARMMRRWAEKTGDAELVRRLDAWLSAGAAALEQHLWNGRFYDASREPESGYHLDFWFTPQLNGQLYARGSGLPGVFPAQRIARVLEQLPKVCAVSKLGIPPNVAGGDFTPYRREKYKNEVLGAGYLSGAYAFTPHQVYMIAQVALYEGRRELGLEILKRIQENQFCRWGGTWEAWNLCSPKADDGARGYGIDYSHNLCLWNTPAALAGEDISGPCQPGGLVARVLQAAAPRGRAK